MADDETAHRGQHRREIQLDTPRFFGFAACERDGIEVLVDANQREPKLRLTCITLGVAPDEVAADPVAEKRCRAGVENAGPYQ